MQIYTPIYEVLGYDTAELALKAYVTARSHVARKARIAREKQAGGTKRKLQSSMPDVASSHLWTDSLVTNDVDDEARINRDNERRCLQGLVRTIVLN